MSFDRPKHRAVPDQPAVNRTSSSPQRDTFLSALRGEISSRYPGLAADMVSASADGPARLKVSREHLAQDPRSRAVGCDMTRHGWRFVWCGGEQDGNPICMVVNLRRAAESVAEALGMAR